MLAFLVHNTQVQQLPPKDAVPPDPAVLPQSGQGGRGRGHVSAAGGGKGEGDAGERETGEGGRRLA